MGDLTLVRSRFVKEGIFGKIPELALYTLEHAFPEGLSAWAPLVPEGIYTCIRGPHRLHGMTEDFTTFEITPVPDHVGVLFHWGNWNKDSSGCVLLGMNATPISLTFSREAFQKFMQSREGMDRFTLTVKNAPV